jgi:flagellin-specific chaperone FliS
MLTRLVESNAQQIDAPLAEVERLLTTLLDGWKAAIPVAHAAGADAYQPVSCTY